MKIEENYKGHYKWRDGARQYILLKNNETKKDAIQYMRAHLEYFGYTDLTFYEKEIEKIGKTYIFTLRKKKV